MSSKEKKELDFLDNPYVKIGYKVVIAAFILGGSIIRYEQKMDEIGNKLLKKIDEHIIADGYEKKELNSRITYLENQIANLQDEAKDYFKTEFIKPEPPSLVRKRRQ